MKKLIWIDDHISKIKSLAQNLFPYLWDKNICNQIIIVGNNYKSENKDLSISDKHITQLKNDISDYFEIFCAKTASKSDDKKTPKQINDSKKDLIIEVVTHINDNDKEKILNNIKSTILKNKENEISIGIDIRLNEKDEQLTNGTLSMRLFHEISNIKNDNTNFAVFLYSSFIGQEDIRGEWEKKYKEIYSDHKVDIKIFSRNDLISCDEKLDDFKSFKKLIKIE